MEMKPGRMSANSTLLRVAKSIIAESVQKTWLAGLLRQRPDWLTKLAAWLNKLTRIERRALRRKLASGVLAAALMSSILGVHPARAANITVDGSCSLESAIASANQNSSVGGCTAGSGADTINLTVDVTLGADLPKITSNITIQGNGHFVSGNNSHRVFWVGEASPGNLTLDNVWVKNGYANGYGAGLYMYGGSTVLVKNSTFSGNFSPYAATAMSVQDTNLTIQNSTITGNVAAGSGGGSAIKVWNNAVVTIQNSTISGNSTASGQGAIYFAYGTSVSIENSIVANQASGVDCSEGAGKNIVSLGHNIEGGTSCGFISAGDLQNVTSGNLKLQTLASSGAGLTPTIALGSGSAALEQIASGPKCGGSYPFNQDQRGEPRPGDKNAPNNCEIGAWEAQNTDLALAVALQTLKANSAAGRIGGIWAALAAIAAAGGALLWRKRSP